MRVEAPRFPGLEVLHTTQEVGVEPELTITAVGGDLLAAPPVRRPTRTPWLAWPLESMSLAKGRILERAVPTSSAAAGMEDAPAEGYGVGGKRPQGKGPRRRARDRAAGAAGAVPPGLREPSDGPSAASAPTTTADAGDARPPPRPAAGPGSLRLRRAGDGGRADEASATSPGPTPPPRSRAARPDSRRREALPSSESGRPGGPFDAGRSGMARKGQLSLDVPVFLAPNRVLSTRIGGGGSLVLDLASKDGSERAYLLLGLAALAAGLAVVALGWLSAGLAVLAGLAVAGILQLVFGASASTLVAAVADGTTLLARPARCCAGSSCVAARTLRGPGRPQARSSPSSAPPWASAAGWRWPSPPPRPRGPTTRQRPQRSRPPRSRPRAATR